MAPPGVRYRKASGVRRPGGTPVRAPWCSEKSKAGDCTRRRGNFALNVRLGPFLEAYYAALERLRPGTMHSVDASGNGESAAAALLQQVASHEHKRYGVEVLDTLKAELDLLLATLPTFMQ